MKRLILNEVKSTNTFAEENSETFSENTLIIAKNQTAGRGQFDHTWFSEKGKSVTLSFFLKDHISEDFIKKIPEIILNAINFHFKINAKIVPPNDIFLNDKKLSGMLIETKYENQKLKYAIIGIGININNEHFPEELKEIATSIKLETKETYSIESFINAIEEEFERKLK